MVPDGLKRVESIVTICRREATTSGLYYCWSREFLEAANKRLKGGTEREASRVRFAGV